MIYKAYLKQKGGCDYTIACGNLIIDLEATDLMDAVIEVSQIIGEKYLYKEGRVDEVEIYEINNSTSFPVKSFYQEIDFREKLKKKEERLQREKEEYERLKAKFGK